jgi:myo-inositol 2-dehydrogenase/D-chiro-inositol 1-dehydrogenase
MGRSGMKSLRLGIIGLGRLGRKHAANIHRNIPGAELHAICSVVAEELDSVAQEMNPAVVTEDYHELLENTDLDGLVVATNSQTHCEIICAAAEAGVRCLFTEKPLGMGIDEIDRIKRAVQKNEGMIFQVGYNHRFDQDLQAAKARIDEGFVGDVILIKMVQRDKMWQEQALVDFAPSSGGLVADMLTHDYDTACWFTGSDAEVIFGLGGVYAFEGLRKVGDIDNVALLMRFRNGVMIQLEATRNNSVGYEAPMEIFGTRGSISIGDRLYKDRITWMNEQGIRRESTQDFFEYWEPTYLAELVHFVDCIREEREPLVGLEDGYRAVQWAVQAGEAVRDGKIVRL